MKMSQLICCHSNFQIVMKLRFPPSTSMAYVTSSQSTTNVEQDNEYCINIAKIISFHFHFISFHIFMEGGPSAITDLQGALRLHYTYITSKRKIITNMKPNYNV